MSELKPEHGTPLDRIVNEGDMLKRPDVGSVGPDRDQAVEWGDSFDVYPNPFNGKDELMTGRDYGRLMARYSRFFSPERKQTMIEDTWSWENDTCDFEGCTEVAPYRRFIDDQPRGHYCEDHMHQVASGHAWFWRDVVAAAAEAEDIDPLERDHSPAAIAEALAPVRHPDRGEGEGE